MVNSFANFYIFSAYSYCGYTYIFVMSLFLRLINVACLNKVFQFSVQFQFMAGARKGGVVTDFESPKSLHFSFE